MRAVEYTQIVILGGCIESYWAALACARQLPVGLIEVSIFDDPAYLQPVVTAGDWLEELHELLGISHEIFLRALQPRLSLGLEVISAQKSFFIPSTQTGFPYKHCSFLRLYAALEGQGLDPYLEYNYAYSLRKAGITSPPRHTASVLCEGLDVVYQFDSKQYKQFLAKALSERSINIYAASTATIQRDNTQKVVALDQWPFLLKDSLLIDMAWGQNTHNQTEIFKHPSPGFFAINQLNVDRKHCLQRMNFSGSWMLESSCQLRGSGEDNSFGKDSEQQVHFWVEGQIKLGATSCAFNVAASAGRIFYQQLQALLLYWPSRESFAVIAKKFNREWSSWRQEIDDMHNLILNAAGVHSVLSAGNKQKIDLFNEVGAVPHSESTIFTNAEWENVLVAGLGLIPGCRGLPRDIVAAEGLQHSMRIKESYKTL